MLVILSEQFPDEHWPALSTGNLILGRNGLAKPKRRIRRIISVHSIFNPHAPNEVWGADFKGHLRKGNRRYCYPLTIADSYSRYLFSAKGLHHPTHEAAMPVFEAVFREFGLPEQIHTANGGPFANAQGLARLTRMSVRFIDLGIDPVYSAPAPPGQNGRYERTRLELKGETARPPAYGLSPQQRKLNSFLREYNALRPHKALDNIPPARVHVLSPGIPEKDRAVGLPKALRRSMCRSQCGHYVGLEELSNGIWRVFYRHRLLGCLDEKTLRIEDEQGRQKRGRSGNRV